MAKDNFVRRADGCILLCDTDVDTSPVRKARRDMKAGKFAPARELLAAAADEPTRGYLMEALGDWDGDEASPVDRWHASEPCRESSLAMCVRLMKHAWIARGGGYAVKDYEAFGNRLKSAEAHIRAVLADSSIGASPLAPFMWRGMAMGDAELCEEIWQQAQRRDPWNRRVHTANTYRLAPRWLGSPGQNIMLARETVRSAPAGSGLASLLIEAHWLTDESEDDRPDTPYWVTDEVREDVSLALELADRDGYHGAEGFRTRQWLAYGLWKAGARANAGDQFVSIGKVWNQWPWGGFTRFNRLLSPFYKARKQSLEARNARRH